MTTHATLELSVEPHPLLEVCAFESAASASENSLRASSTTRIIANAKNAPTTTATNVSRRLTRTPGG